MRCLLVVLALAAVARADDAPADLTAPARELFRVVACGDEDALPPKLDEATASAHCQKTRGRAAELRAGWVATAGAWLARVVPPAPAEVVVPFGDGDLLGALVTFPDATTITTLGPSPSGDVRRIAGFAGLTKDKLWDALAAEDKTMARLGRAARGKATTLDLAADTALPDELVLASAALATLGYDLVSCRYFHLGGGGTLAYLGAQELAASDAAATKLVGRARLDAQAAPFDDVELTFRKHGDAAAPLKTFRHLRAALDDAHWADVRAHLEAKGPIAAMMRGQSFALWWSDFGALRGYLLAHATVMVSDATGIPPRFATAAHFTVAVYGELGAPFEDVGEGAAKELAALWQAPSGPVPFLYGVPDADQHANLMIVRRP